MNKGQIRLFFKHKGTVETTELAHFLFLFRGAYAASLSVVEGINAKNVASNASALESKLKIKLKKFDVSAIDSLFSRNLGQNALIPEKISHRSPLEIIIAGALSALTLAVILSGGKIKFGIGIIKIEADLPPIGDGIKRLRNALTKAPKSSLVYGVKGRLIKLSRDEFVELMKFDPATEKRGGFQRLLIGMQYRVSRKTRELVLSDDEMDMILRYGRQPEKGGWQKSINTIFGRHFDLNSK